MADQTEGLLSQDDINAALAAAGISGDAGVDKPASSPASRSQTVSAPPPRADSARPFEEVAAAMAEAAAAEGVSAATGAQTFEIPELRSTESPAAPAAQAIDLLRDVELNVKIELGRSRMRVDDVLRLGEGSVVELDKLAGDPVDVFVNNRLVARGEVLVLNDNFCVRINEIVVRTADAANWH